jgi:hypothetical protein
LLSGGTPLIFGGGMGSDFFLQLRGEYGIFKLNTKNRIL